jgi:hypothetical protein
MKEGIVIRACPLAGKTFQEQSENCLKNTRVGASASAVQALGITKGKTRTCYFVDDKMASYLAALALLFIELA